VKGAAIRTTALLCCHGGLCTPFFISVVFTIEIGIVNITLLYMFHADIEADMFVNRMETSSDLSGLMQHEWSSSTGHWQRISSSGSKS